MTGYLLGELSEEERTKFEIRYLADDSLFEQMLLVKEDLIDDYVRQRLDAATREKFERHFLATPEGRQEIAFAHALRVKLNEEETEKTEQRQFKLPEWLGGWSFRELLLAGATVLMFVGGAWLWNQNRKLRTELFGMSAQNTEQARRNAELQQQLANLRLPSPVSVETESTKPTNSPQPAYNLLAINLALSNSRGSAEPIQVTEITLPEGEIRPDLTIRLRFKPVGSTCTVVLKAPDGTSAERREVRAYSKEGYFLRVTFPQVKLKTGDYEIIVQGRDIDDDSEKTDSYLFRLKQ